MRYCLPLLLYGVVQIIFSCCKPEHTNTLPAKETSGFPNHVVATLDSFVWDLYESRSLPGVAIAVVSDDANYYKAIGKIRLSSTTPFTDSTSFFTGNLSELMVGTAVLTLVQQGKLNLDDPVVKHLPYFKLEGNTYRNITIRNLLTHTSGIPHHDAIWDLPVYDDHALESTTRSIALQQPSFEPGTQVRRTPYNYDILADLIAHASGTSFEDYVLKNLFAPLHMTKSTFSKMDLDDARIARPHRVDNWLTYSLKEEENYPYNREHAGSIGFHTSIKDITHWMNTILRDDNGLLKKPLYHEFMKPQYKTGHNAYMGVGWEIDKLNEELRYSKTHQTGGFCAAITLIPKKRTGVLVISNTSDVFNPAMIGDQIIAYLDSNKALSLNVPIHRAMGNKLQSTGSLDSAFALYLRAKQTHAKHYDFSVESLSQLGVNLLYRLHNPEQAKRAFQFCLEQHKTSAYAHLNLAEAYLLSSEFAQAKEALHILKQLPPDHPELHSRLHFIEGILNDKTETDNQAITN